MVLKRKNKVPKRLKKGMHGGDIFEDIKNDLLSLRLDTKVYTEWKNFITYLIDIFKSEQPKKEDGEHISEEDYIASLIYLRTQNIIRPSSARPSSARPSSARPSSARPSSALSRTNAFIGQIEEKPQSLQVKKPQVLNPEKQELIISKFYTTFQDILKIVKIDRNNKSKLKKFKDLMEMVNRLPNIDNSLDTLIVKDDSSEDQKNLKSVYLKILQLLKENCSGWRGTFCSGAVLILGEDVQKLYEELKKNIKLKEDQISNDILIKFIKDVLPIMKPKLVDITEFNAENIYLDEIASLLQQGGGKKSSRAIRKEIQGKPIVITKKLILGKERCIYKVQGSNKEHVKYKGSLIPVADYKKLMKV
jgi:hypothetical protein